ncbi:hypothetical protein HY643_03105 [Candidatus Woesearchaeota archaeon]|nr:hypothetical protein [Candidatus Woesearchaeota archaeon]
MEKDYTKYILYGLLIVVVAGLIFALIQPTWFNTKKASSNGKTTAYAPPNSQGFETKASGNTDEGNVGIDLTPEGVENGQLKVTIAANTHSVDLSQFDLKQITTLEYNGKSIKPSSAPSLSGHHVTDALVFDVGEETKSFTITIKGIPKVEERVFKWE